MAKTLIGERDKPITLQRVTDAVASSGFPTETTAVTIKLFAAKRDLTNSGWSRERFTGDQVSARMETEWDLPYRSDIDPEKVDVAKTFRLVYQGRTHDIVIASLKERKGGILLTTTVRTG